MIYIDDHIRDLNLPEALAVVGPQRRDYALRYRREQDQRLCLAAYLLLQRALRTEYGITVVPPFVYGVNGKPSLKGYPDIHFNLSHCNEAAVCAVADWPVGIDVESINSYDTELFPRTMSVDEQRIIAASPQPDAAFIRLWTMKESLLKLTGEGMRDDLPGLLQATGEQYRFTSWHGKGYIGTLCEKAKCQ